MKKITITRKPSSVRLPIVTAFTTDAPTGRVFNSRFSNRFKKS